MEWRETYRQAQKDESNVDFSSRKHFQAAKATERDLNAARVFVATGSAVAAGGALATIISTPGTFPRLAKVAPLLSAVASVSVGIVSAIFLAPTFAQRVVRHREAGVAYESLRQQYARTRTHCLLNSRTTLNEADAAVQDLASKKTQLDKEFKDCVPPNSIHLKQKHYVHGPAPENLSWFENVLRPDVYQARWSAEFNKRQAIPLEEWVKARQECEMERSDNMKPCGTEQSLVMEIKLEP
jgi:hypothetical protein